MTYQEIVKNINILLVDDDKDYLNMTNIFLKQLGYKVDIAEGGKSALEALSKKDYQILLLDFFMPDMTGEEVIKKVRESNSEIIIILQTGFAGQNPPADMMKELNIQNYFDKTEGIGRLELEIISAVRIVNQQNEIEFSKYKSSIIGELIVTIAEEVKQILLSIGAGIEATNLLTVNDENSEKITKVYALNKQSLERVDKMLTAIHTSANADTIITDDVIITIVDIIVANISKKKNVKYSSKVALKSKAYFNGNISDIVFILCSLLKQTILVCSEGDNVEFVITDDEENWYFNIRSEKMCEVSSNELYKAKKIIGLVEGCNLECDDKKIVINMKK